MNYYTAIALITEFIAMVLVATVSTNRNFHKKTRKGLIITFSLVMLGSLCDWLSAFIEIGSIQVIIKGLDYIKMLEFILRLARFVLMPILPIICAKALFQEKAQIMFSDDVYKILKKFILTEEVIVVLSWIILSYNSEIFYKTIYKLYVSTFIISTIFLFASALEFSQFYQTNNMLQLIIIIVFVTIGIIMQILNPKIRICWIIIAVSSNFIYVYYNELIQCIDGLTQLLNKISFNNYLLGINKKIIVIIFDIDSFKKINDNFGHEFGDKILKIVSKTLKEKYQNYGRVYRIGGDEFAVILERNLENVGLINDEFKRAIEEEREKDDRMPSVSYGLESYDPKNKEVHCVFETMENADKRMYKNKEQNNVKNK